MSPTSKFSHQHHCPVRFFVQFSYQIRYLKVTKRTKFNSGDVHGVKSRTKCTIVEATGVETIRYEDDEGQEREFDVDYKIYDRTVFTVYEDTSFYDYNGDLEFNEDAVMCGANRTECSGVS